MQNHGSIARLGAVAALVALCWSGCATGNGKMVTEPRKVGDFAFVSVAIPAVVEIAHGDERSVEVRTDSDVANSVKTFVTNETLYVGFKGNKRASEPVRVRVVTPKLEGVTVINTKSLKLVGVDTRSLEVNVDGDTEASITGRVMELELKSTNGARIDGTEFSVGTARVTLTGDAEVSLDVTELLDVRANAGVVRYVNEPKEIQKQLLGDAKIEQFVAVTESDQLDEALGEGKGKKDTGTKSKATSADEEKKKQDAIDKAMGL